MHSVPFLLGQHNYNHPFSSQFFRTNCFHELLVQELIPVILCLNCSKCQSLCRFKGLNTPKGKNTFSYTVFFLNSKKLFFLLFFTKRAIQNTRQQRKFLAQAVLFAYYPPGRIWNRILQVNRFNIIFNTKIFPAPVTMSVNQATKNALCLWITNITRQLQQFSIFWKKSSNIIGMFTILFT